MAGPTSIEDALAEIESLEIALRGAQEDDGEHSSAEADETPAFVDTESRVNDIQHQLAKLYDRLDFLKQQKAAQDGIPISKDSAILFADVGFGFDDNAEGHSSFLPTDKLVAMVCPFDSDDTKPPRTPSPDKIALPPKRNAPRSHSAGHSLVKDEDVPSHLYESARMCNGFQIVKHRGSDRITVQVWAWINPKIGPGRDDGSGNEEDEFFDTSQDLPEQDGSLHDELLHLSSLVDSIRLQRPPPKEEDFSHQLDELLALDAEVGSILQRGGAAPEDARGEDDAAGGESDISNLRIKMERNRARLRQIRATARRDRDLEAPDRVPPALERSPSTVVREDMRRLRQQLHDLRSFSPHAEGELGRSRSPAMSMTSSLPSPGRVSRAEEQDLEGMEEARQGALPPLASCCNSRSNHRDCDTRARAHKNALAAGVAGARMHTHTNTHRHTHSDTRE